ncbi:hypothetical protein, partial [Mesorhizobium sp. M1A.F.Ca.IN.020.06.1.1]|uniref:hypothetical protein n=1 Tax=Mesorhizobium sp. M1A.F.Ca.IN.020.06.1.1 TaxID=2496765 RepID=UPI0013E3E8AD
IAAPQESRQRAIQVQAIWNRLTEPQPGVDPSTVLMHPSVIQSLTPNFNCLTSVQQERLVALVEGLANRKDRALALRAVGTGLGGLAPALQQRLIALAEGFDNPEQRASALRGLGAGVAGLAPALQQRLVLLTEGLALWHRVWGLEGLGAGVAGLAPALQ